jgi:hypothetical protein
MVAPIADRPRFGRFTVIQGAAMAEKVVDVFLKDSLVASYPVAWDMLNAPISDQDFIGLGSSVSAVFNDRITSL